MCTLKKYIFINIPRWMDEENQDIMERKDDGCAGSSNEAICVCVCLS